MGQSISCEKYLIDFPSDKSQIGHIAKDTATHDEITFDGELADCRHLNVRALFAAFLARYSRQTEIVFRQFNGDNWQLEACRVDLAADVSIFEEIELPEAAEEGAPGLAVGFSTKTLQLQDLTGSHLDFVMQLELGAQTRVRCFFAAKHFDPEGARYRLHAFVTMLQAAIAEPGLAARDLALSSELDAQLLVGINNNSLGYDDSVPVHQRFEAQAALTPESEAVRFDGRSMNYRELDQRSNQLAHYLRAKGAGRGIKVGLFVERSERMIVAMLGILKSGAAYIPLDPGYPAERIAYIAEDSKVPMIVTETSLISLLDTDKTTPVMIDELDAELEQQPSTALDVGVQADDAIYLIYTSGSTGKPKGVQISHCNAVTFLDSMLSMAPLNRVDRTLTLTSLCFDVSVPEIYCTLLIGGCVVVASRATATNPVALAKLIEDEAIETIHATPSTWRLLLETGWKNDRVTGLTAGEPYPREMVAPILAATREFWNFYGPTEATVYSTGYQMTDGTAPVHIGKPIPNYSIRICDEHGHAVPFGAAGEMWIGGAGVAQGYSNREDLNALQFPLRDGERFYRTGDAVRLMLDGNIEYHSRLDGQVKVNGYRIELGEIEAVLSEHVDVSRAVVDVQSSEDDNKSLVAWCLMEDGKTLEVAELKQHLRDRLPPYMVPVAWAELQEVPINPNGKVDRKALPKVEFADIAAPQLQQTESTATADDQMRYARELWLQMLNLDKCDEQASFFELGGTSMLALQFVNRMNAATGADHSIVDFFSHPNLQAWSEHVRQSAGTQVREQLAGKSNESVSHQDIAIVGMAVHVPGAKGLQQYWQNIVDGVESISHFSREEMLIDLPADVIDEPAYVAARGVLEDYDKFDNEFFSVNPREASVVDPQQRLFLQTAWHAFEDAAQVPDAFDGLVGVYAGTYYNTYHSNNATAHPNLVESMGHVQEMIASEKDYVATRVAHKFNLKGPAVSIHTACSTSMVAIAQACGALRLGQCDMAVAGGASVTAPVASGHEFQEGGVFCSDGHTRSFSADADGTMFCDGVGAVILKRVDDAVAAGDRIYAVIKAAAINNDGGGKMSFMAPSSDGQAAVVEAALRESGVPADTIGYLEAHGTATPVGDPIEVEGLRRAYDRFTDKRQYCAIGSVKSNIGHLTAAAGVAGLIKTALTLHHKIIPPSLFCEPVNPAIRFERTPFYPAAKRQDWVSNEHPRRAGVSSFGVGGTNAHAILEEFNTPESQTLPTRSRELLLLSAKTRESLDTATTQLADCLRASPTALGDVAHTLLHGRSKFTERRFVVSDGDQVVARLGELQDSFSATSAELNTSGKVAFMFPGQGSQYAGMGSNLYQTESVYRDAVDRCAEILLPELAMDIRDLLLAEGDSLEAAQELVNETRYTQPSLFVTGYALSQLWASWGVKPAALIGHSIGEFVAAHLAGVFSLQDALMLVARRGAMMQSLPSGSMLSVRLGEQALQAVLPEALSVAAINGPNLCVVAGEDAAIEAFAKQCEHDDIVCRALQTSHAFHSHMMDPIVDDFAALVASTSRQAPSIDIVSTADAGWQSAERAMDPDYWAQHLRRAVRFAEGVRVLWDREDYVLLELGPRATATTLARQQVCEASRQVAIASLADHADQQREVEAVLSAVGRLWQCDIAIDWQALHGEASRRVVSLPGYAFAKTRFWLESRHALKSKAASGTTSPASSTESISISAISESTVMTHPSVSRQQHLVSLVKELFEETSGMDLQAADAGGNFMSLGLDSLFLTQAGNSVKKKFGVAVSFRQLMESVNNFDALASLLDGELAEGKFEPEEVVVQAPVAQTAAPAAAETVTAAAVAPTVQVPQLTAAAGVSVSAVESLVQQQLLLMSQQLQLLGGAAVTSAPVQVPAPAQAQAPSVANAVVATAPAQQSAASTNTAQDASTEAKPFGAQARISTEHSGDMSPAQLDNLQRFIEEYNLRTKSSKAYAQEHRATFSDPRIVSGFTPVMKEAIYPMVVNRSAGSKLWDIDDNEYIDITNCFGANFLGYGVEQIKEAMHRQIDMGFEIGPTTPDSGEVAKLACELTGNERFAFCNTGSEAVLGAVRAARSITARDVVVSFNGDYHGLFDEVIVRGSPSLRSFAAASGIPQTAVSQTLILDYGVDAALDQIRERADDIAAVLVEPVQSRNPGLQPKEFLQKLRALTEELDIALIFDEVITGFRIHPGGAQAHFGIRADIATYGKIVGGGMPIGMIGGKAKYMDAFDGGQWQFGDDSAPEVGVTYLAGTFVRHPLTMAASKALLQTIKAAGTELYDTVNARADRMATELNNYFEQRGTPYKLANFGSLFKLGYPLGATNAELLFMFARHRGVHVWDGLPMCLTAAHSDADVDRVIDVFKAAVDDMLENGFIEPAAAQGVGDVHQRVRLIEANDGQVNWGTRDDRQDSHFKVAK